MIRYLFLLVILCSFSILYSQPKSGSISGRIIDEYSSKPVEFATVAVLKAIDSSLVSGAISNQEGRFVLSDIGYGNFILQVTFIGYNRKFINVNLNETNSTVRLNEIKIREAAISLDQVTVTAEKSIIENKIDRKVFNVSQSVTSSSGNATDILKQVPSVEVDGDGNVSLRGNDNVVMLINGKPSALSGDSRAAVLRSLPANMIENIEVITNPSAKYDPDGITGIININLKKEARLGLNGSASINYGTMEKINGQASVGYNSGKWNLNGSYSGRYNTREGYGFTNREIRQKDSLGVISDTTFTNQKDNSTDKGTSHMGRFGVDYNINDNNSIGIISSAMFRNDADFDWVNYTKSNSKYTTIDSIYRHNDEKEDGFNVDNNLYFIHKFDKKNEELKFNFTRSDNFEIKKIDFYNKSYFNPEDTSSQRDQIEYNSASTTVQVDYTNPINEKVTFETGWKSVMNSQDNDYTRDNLMNGSWENDLSLSNHFLFNEQIHALYGTWKQQMGSFGYQAGLRGEYYKRDFELKNTGENKSKDYFNLYPSLHLQQNLNKENELQLSYSRRVNRPRGSSLNPLIRYYSPNTASSGNPELNPEYVNSISFSHLWKRNRNTITSEIFFRHTVNQFTRMVESMGDGTLIRSVNLNNSSAYGMEVTAIYYLTKWWYLNANGSLYNYTIDGTNLGSGKREALSYQGKLISNISVPGNFSVQLSGFYNSKRINIDGEMLPFYAVEGGVQKEVLKGNGTINLRVSDIFNTMAFRMNTRSETLIQDMERRRESRVVYVGFTYRFGKQSKGRRQEREPRDSDDMNGGGDMF